MVIRVYIVMLRRILCSFTIIKRGCTTVNGKPPAPVKVLKKVNQFHGISKHLQHAKEYEKSMSAETSNYEEGIRYLAHMMGKDENDFSESDVQYAVAYLFPSSLYSQTARPMLLPPSQIIPKQKSLQCSMDGRPFEPFYYTRYPAYFRLMNEAAELLYDLKRVEDANIQKGILTPPENKEWEEMKNSTDWVEPTVIKKMTLERTSSKHYEQFIVLMERILEHPYSHTAKEFITRFRKSKPMEVKSTELPELTADKDTGRTYSKAYGQRKRAFAEVRVFWPGSGEISVNRGLFLEAFPLINDREQVLTPLVFTGQLGKVDVHLRVSGGGNSGRSGAARLAIARGLTCFLDEGSIQRLRLAGLLTMDMRFKEKKKSGMPKARRTYIWKRR